MKLVSEGLEDSFSKSSLVALSGNPGANSDDGQDEANGIPSV
jgi:hypothetical protein